MATAMRPVQTRRADTEVRTRGRGRLPIEDGTILQAYSLALNFSLTRQEGD